MKTEKTDVATLIELLKMAAERWPHFETDQLSQHDLLREIPPYWKCGQKPANALAWESANSHPV